MVAFTLLPNIWVLDKSSALFDVSILLLFPTIWTSVRFFVLFFAFTVFFEPVIVIPDTLPASSCVVVSVSPLTVLLFPVSMISVSPVAVSFLTMLLFPVTLLFSPSNVFSFPKTPELTAVIFEPLLATGVVGALFRAPMTYVPAPLTVLAVPIAPEDSPVALAVVPIAKASFANACARSPKATALRLLLLASLPIATALSSEAPAA